MDIGILIAGLIFVLFVVKILWALQDAKGHQGNSDNYSPVYQNYDDTASTIRSRYIPYNSYEFAGVAGFERTQLETSRGNLLKSLATDSTSIWDLLVLSDELVEQYIDQLTFLKNENLCTGIVVLNNGKKYLASMDNGRYITAVENSDGVPFSIEDIREIIPTPHWVSLKTMESRMVALKKYGLLDRMVKGSLEPGNYKVPVGEESETGNARH